MHKPNDKAAYASNWLRLKNHSCSVASNKNEISLQRINDDREDWTSETVDDNYALQLKSDHVSVRKSVQLTMNPVTNPSKCQRCNKTVYPKEKIEPRSNTVFHNTCFRCCECGIKLNLITFFANSKDSRDEEVYCKAHAPQLDPAKVDNSSKSIADFQHLPKLCLFNNHIRGPEAGKAIKFDSNALGIQSALNVQRLTDRSRSTNNPLTPPNEIIKSELIGLRYL